jgi:hypothetical protein
VSVKALAKALPPQRLPSHQLARRYQRHAQRPLCRRTGAPAADNVGKARLRPEQWLIIEWPADQDEPTKYCLSILPESTPLNELVSAAHQRRRIERDYQDLKQDFGLGHYEGRGRRGFHHHGALCIAAYGFLMAARLTADKPVGGKTTSPHAQCLHFPRIASPAAVLRAQRYVGNSITTLRHHLCYQLMVRLGRCPCCGRRTTELRL